MDPKYQQIIFELQTNISNFETDIISEITDIMTTNNYVHFYKFQNDWIFVDSSGNHHPAEANIQQPLDEYYETIDRPNLDITL